MEVLASEAGRDSIEVGPVRELPKASAGATRAESITNAVLADEAAFHILFIHADADGDPERARRERVEPAKATLAEALSPDTRQVAAIIPIRTTEAWALSDITALRTVLSTDMTARELGLPESSAALERASDPKALLDDAVRRARGGRTTRRRPSGSAFLEVLGELVAIERLRTLDAYRTFESELLTAIAGLGYIRE